MVTKYLLIEMYQGKGCVLFEVVLLTKRLDAYVDIEHLHLYEFSLLLSTFEEHMTNLAGI